MDENNSLDDSGLRDRLQRLLDETSGLDQGVRRRVLELFDEQEHALGDELEEASRGRLLDNAADTIIVHTLDGVILWVNAFACQRLGYQRSELVGMHLRKLSTEFNPDMYALRMKRVCTRMNYVFETHQRHRDGYSIPFEVNARKVEYGGETAIMSIARDLTARKAAESIMLEQKQFLTAVLEHLPVGLFVKQVHPELSVQMWNAAMEEMTGLSREEAIGKTVFDLHESKFAEAYHQSDLEAIRRRAPVVVPMVKISRGDRNFIVRAIKVPLFDENEKPIALLVMMVDETERLNAEASLLKVQEELERRVAERTAELQQAHDRLKETEEHYRGLYEQAAEAIFVLDEEGRFLQANPAAKEIFGYREREIRELHPLDLLHPAEMDNAPKVLGAVRRGEIVHMEVRLRRKDGTFAEVEMAAKRIGSKHVLATLWDITERKRMEQELRRAKVAAERANEAKSEFLANMSHEIRTPMGGILGMTDMVLAMDLKEGQREYLKGIKSASLSLLDIINDILDFSKIEANKLELAVEPFSLRERVESLYEAFRVNALSKDIELSLRIGEAVPDHLLGDAGRLGQVLANLLSNAIKFTDAGNVDLDIILLDRREDEVELRFVVADTGIGIPEGQANRLFDVFSQLDTSLSKRQPGTGLGLSISRRLVEMMGGEIHLESEAGVGSCFSFELRLGLRNSLVNPSAPAAEPETQQVAGVRVLLAEDNLLNQEFLTYFLEEAGHTVRVADNGRHVLQVLAEEKFDIVLMDIQMPEMDGLQATRHIRAHDGTEYDPDIPIVALTAYAMKGDKERMLGAGMNDYLSKPVDMERLLGLISALVGASGRG